MHAAALYVTLYVIVRTRPRAFEKRSNLKIGTIHSYPLLPLAITWRARSIKYGREHQQLQLAGEQWMGA